jgi:hypothetical protein
MFEASAAHEPTDSAAGTAGVCAAGVSAASDRALDSRLCLGSFEALFDQLTELVTAVGECGVPVDSSALVGLRAQIDRLAAMVAEAEIRFDQAELWRDEGAGSLRGWMADHCGLGRRAATVQARRVERLEQWPEVAQAWSAGRLSAAQVDVVVGVVPRRFAALFAQQAASVVDIVAPLTVGDTELAMRQWVRCAENTDGPQQLGDRSSGLYFNRVLDGRFTLEGHFEGADAAVIAAALHDFDVPDALDEHGDPIGPVRTLSQRNADALLAACRFAIAHREGAGDTGRFLPHVSLVIDVNELRASALRGAGVHSHAGLEQLAEARGWSAAERAWFTDTLDRNLAGTAVTFDGTDLDAAATGLLTCDSVVQRVMVAGDKVLNMGREIRTATVAQRRAIITRDRHCRAPGCSTKAKHCDVHHVDHWINGGRTDVHRMVLLCGTHHRQFHRPGYRMELDDNAVFTVHAPSGWSRSTTPDRIETQHFARVT